LTDDLDDSRIIRSFEVEGLPHRIGVPLGCAEEKKTGDIERFDPRKIDSKALRFPQGIKEFVTQFLDYLL
jgi:hypothetical protein